jgi:hypothetical protein
MRYFTGSAAGSDAGNYWDAGSLHADFGKRVEVGLFCGFELRFAARRQGQATEAVGDEQDDFGVVLDVEFAGEGVGVHVRVQGSGFRARENPR